MKLAGVKLGIVADEISRDFATAVHIGKDLGLRRYEIRNLPSGRAPMCGPQEMLEVEQIAAREEVEITALSPGLFKLTDSAAEFAREMSEIYPRAAEWAHRWSLPGLIVFGFNKGAGDQGPGARDRVARDRVARGRVARDRVARDRVARDRVAGDRVVDWLAEAGARAHSDGLLLMVEPEPICCADTGLATADLIRRAGVPSLHINYDPGNVAWQTGRDPIDEFETVAPLIANVHIKDLGAGGQARQSASGPGAGVVWVPPGEGIIDYRAHFRALQRTGYQGPISLEPHMDGSRETTRACKNAFESLWEGT